jgi:adenylate kinase
MVRLENYRQIAEHIYRPESYSNNKIAVTTGLSGCGKDFVIGKFIETGHPNANLSVQSFGEELFRHLRTRFPQLTSRDDMRNLPHTDMSEGIIGAIDELVSKQPLLLNTQVVYRQGNGLSTNPSSDLRLNPSLYLFVWTDPLDIYNWRQADSSRRRPIETIDEIAVNQSLALAVVSRIALLNGSSLHTIENRIDNVAQNTALFGQYIADAKLV